MPDFMKQGAAKETARTYFPSFLRSRIAAIRADMWVSGHQAELNDTADAVLRADENDVDYGLPFSPKDTEAEYDNLQSLSPNAFGGLVVATLAQTAHIEGMRRPGSTGQLPAWETFRRNRLLSKQNSIHRAAIGMAQAYGIVIPGADPLTGNKMSKILLRSPKRMAAFYDNDDDEWPVVAIDAWPRYERQEGIGGLVQVGWYINLWDAYVVHRLTCDRDGLNADQWTYLDHQEHGIPVPPVARCVNRIDLDGRATGEIEPVLPLLRRIDQDTFDRLITQRFGAWQVRYIAGMAKPDSKTEARIQALKLRQEDLLVSTNPETKFGVLPAGALKPFVEATDHDLRLLAAITQTPPHHLLGLSSNLQAEALAAAEAGLQRKSHDFKTNAGEFYEQLARLDAMVRGDMQTAAAWDLQTRWRDDEARSFAQTVQALGVAATQLKIPIEMLWEKFPGWTDDDVNRAKDLVEDGTFQQMLDELFEGAAEAEKAAQGAPSGDGN